MHYENDGLICRGIEVPFTLPIIDPDTGEETGQYYGGLIDAIVEKDGKLWLCDHKTASKADFSYWEELKTNPQLSKYLLASRQIGLSVQGFIWDVIVKSSLSAKKLTKADVKGLTEDEPYYCSIPYKPLPGACDIQYGDKENPRLLGIRTHVKYVEDANKMFIRRKVRRTQSDIYEFAYHLRDVARLASESREKAKTQDLLRNFGNCKAFNSLCDFHGICANEVEKTDETKFRPRTKDNREGGAPASGSLSISQLTVLQSCARKWQYQYVDKIESIAPESAALNFGKLVHSALEIFLKSRLVDPITFPNEIPS